MNYDGIRTKLSNPIPNLLLIPSSLGTINSIRACVYEKKEIWIESKFRFTREQHCKSDKDCNTNYTFAAI